MDAFAAAQTAAGTGADRHIIDVLIEERAPRLTASLAWPLIQPFLYGMLDYGKAVAMADAIRPMSGAEALIYCSGLLDLQVEALHLDRVPERGRCVVICNHPTGIADGVAVYDAMNRVRDDSIYFANADALRVCRRLDEVLIPVEWVEAKRTREKTRATLAAAKAAFDAERAVVIFPAGRLARRGPDGALSDPPWAATAVSLARRHKAPIVPVHLSGPWSGLFHFFDRFSPELRDVTLFHELLNKTGRPFRLVAGLPIDPADLPAEAPEATRALKHFVEQVLPARPDAEFE